MATTQNDIRRWLLEAKGKRSTHVIVVCDTFSWEDYPVSVQPGEQVREQVATYDGKSMQKIMEVYDLSLDIESQLREHTAWHL